MVDVDADIFIAVADDIFMDTVIDNILASTYVRDQKVITAIISLLNKMSVFENQVCSRKSCCRLNLPLTANLNRLQFFCLTIYYSPN